MQDAKRSEGGRIVSEGCPCGCGAAKKSHCWRESGWEEASTADGLRKVIEKAQGALFDVLDLFDDPEHRIECHADTVVSSYRRLSLGASLASDVLSAAVSEMIERTPLTPKGAIAELEHSERAYLSLRRWERDQFGLWIDPLNPKKSHIQRVAAYKQRQRDANAEDMK